MPNIRVQLKLARFLCVFVGLLYLFFLMWSVFVRSSERQRVKELSLNGESIAKGHAVGEDSAITIHIKDFYRVELKSGKPAWEIRGKNAELFAKQSITRITDANMLYYRDDGGRVTLTSLEARIFANDSVLERVYLEGDVKVTVEAGPTVEANSGVYDKVEDTIEGYGDCRVSGVGYDVTGDTIALRIGEEEVSIHRNVHTRIVPGGVDMSKLKEIVPGR